MRRRCADLYERFEFKSPGSRTTTAPRAAAPRLRDNLPRGAPRSVLIAASRSSRNYETVLDQAAFDRWLATIDAASLVSFDTETTSLDPMQARIVGHVVRESSPAARRYIPLAHRYAGAPAQLPLDGDARAAQALVRESVQMQARPERQVRPARAGQSRHRARRCGARHDAAVLRRSNRIAARHGRSRFAASRRQDRSRMPRSPARARTGSASIRSRSSARASTRQRTPTSRCSCIALLSADRRATPGLRTFTRLSSCRRARCSSAWSATACWSTPRSWRRRASELGERIAGARNSRRTSSPAQPVQPRLAASSCGEILFDAHEAAA